MHSYVVILLMRMITQKVIVIIKLEESFINFFGEFGQYEKQRDAFSQ